MSLHKLLIRVSLPSPFFILLDLGLKRLLDNDETDEDTDGDGETVSTVMAPVSQEEEGISV